MVLEAGTPAPGFSLRNQHGQRVALADFAGTKDVLLVFYPFAFSNVCTGELCEIRDSLDDLSDDETEIVAVSCDPVYSLRAYADRDGYTFSLLSDFWPHGEVSRAFGVFDDKLGCSGRATLIVDKAGVVRWSVHNAISEARSLADYREVLSAIRA